MAFREGPPAGGYQRVTDKLEGSRGHGRGSRVAGNGEIRVRLRGRSQGRGQERAGRFSARLFQGVPGRTRPLS